MVIIKAHFDKLKEAVNKIQNLTRLLKSPNNVGKRAKYSRELSLSKQKVKFYLNKLSAVGQGNAIIVKYKESAPTYSYIVEAMFTNITEEDVKTILKCREELYGYTIEILEIKDHPTYVRNLGL